MKPYKQRELDDKLKLRAMTDLNVERSRDQQERHHSILRPLTHGVRNALWVTLFGQTHQPEPWSDERGRHQCDNSDGNKGMTITLLNDSVE